LPSGVNATEPEGMIVKDLGSDTAYFTFPFSHVASGSQIRVAVLFHIPHGNTGSVIWQYEFTRMASVLSNVSSDTDGTDGGFTSNFSGLTTGVTSTISGGGSEFWLSRWSVDPTSESLVDGDLVRTRITNSSGGTMNGTVIVQGFFISYWVDHPLTV
jgi:hypothetical protein